MSAVQRLGVRAERGWKRGLKGAWPIPQATGLPSPILGLAEAI